MMIPGVLISACLFGDGAGAAVLSRHPPSAARRVQWRGTASLIDPAERQALRFEHRDGLLRNILTRSVPRLAARYVHEVLSVCLRRADLTQEAVTGWILHAGGARRALRRAGRTRTTAVRVELQPRRTAGVWKLEQRLRVFRAR